MPVRMYNVCVDVRVNTTSYIIICKISHLFCQSQPHDFRKCLRSKCLTLTNGEGKESKNTNQEPVGVSLKGHLSPDQESGRGLQEIMYPDPLHCIHNVTGSGSGLDNIKSAFLFLFEWVLLILQNGGIESLSTWTSLMNVFIPDVKVDYSCFLIVYLSFLKLDNLNSSYVLFMCMLNLFKLIE